MPARRKTEDAAVEMWLSASLSSSFDHVLREAIPEDLLALVPACPERG